MPDSPSLSRLLDTGSTAGCPADIFVLDAHIVDGTGAPLGPPTLVPISG